MKTKKATGLELIAQERQEQILKHMRTVESDVQCNDLWQLADAARKLISEPDNSNYGGVSIQLGALCSEIQNDPPLGWDISIWKKMCSKPYKERLIIAGALAAAEYDRLNAIG